MLKAFFVTLCHVVSIKAIRIIIDNHRVIYNNRNFLHAILPGELPIFFVCYHFIFTVNQHGVV